jgi:hypothetical protein
VTIDRHFSMTIDSGALRGLRVTVVVWKGQAAMAAPALFITGCLAPSP